MHARFSCHRQRCTVVVTEDRSCCLRIRCPGESSFSRCVSNTLLQAATHVAARYWQAYGMHARRVCQSTSHGALNHVSVSHCAAIRVRRFFVPPRQRRIILIVFLKAFLENASSGRVYTARTLRLLGNAIEFNLYLAKLTVQRSFHGSRAMVVDLCGARTRARCRPSLCDVFYVLSGP